jgi:hypothetical protein
LEIIMLKKSIAIAAITIVAAAASAQEATPDTWMGEAKSVLSSADVRTEAAQMLASGELAQIGNPGYLPTVADSKLRAEVIAELQRARDSGEFSVLNAEAHEFVRAEPPIRTAWFRTLRLF